MRKPRFRAERRRQLSARGIKPANQMQACHIDSRFELPLTDWMKANSFKALDLLWFTPGTAVKVCSILRYLGISYNVIRAEYRRCEVCNRALLGAEATARRFLLETSPEARNHPCGERCKFDADSRLWDILKESHATL